MNLYNEKYSQDLLEKSMEHMGFKKKTEKYWSKLTNECLLPTWFIKEYTSDSKQFKEYISSNRESVFNSQIELMRKYDVNPTGRQISEMIDFASGRDLIYKLTEYFIETENINGLKEAFRRRNHYYIDNDIKRKIIKLIGINEAFIYDLTDDILVKENINDFDSELIIKHGMKRLSIDFAEYLMEDKKVNMADIDIDNRPNIGFSKMPGYISGGFCKGETHTNGIDIYMSYGSCSDLFNALDYASLVLLREIGDCKSDIDKYKDNEDVASKHLTGLNKERLEQLERTKYIIDCFSDVQSDI